ncbi:hypothetical protein FJY93_04140 [Candidatus Kaiserbacteria bacterium]|nr:hypothetical protein [Candidatus Kaiserbacteria bacterium]
MGTIFDITLHNLPKYIETNAVFKRDFKKRVQRLLNNYHLDNDLEGNEIEAYIDSDSSEDPEEVFITCVKRDDETRFTELEYELMYGIGEVLEELVKQYEDEALSSNKEKKEKRKKTRTHQ